MAQLASVLFLGNSSQSSADNLLLDGRIIDEMDWTWPHQRENLKIHVDMIVRSPIGISNISKSLDQVRWQENPILTNSFSKIENSIQIVCKAMEAIFDVKLNLDQMRQKCQEFYLSLFQDKSSEFK